MRGIPVLLLLVAAASPMAATAAPSKPGRVSRVQMVSSSRKVSAGDWLTVRVRLDNGINVGSVPFHVTYNPQVLEFDSGEEGTFLNRDGAQTAFFATPTSKPGEIVVGLSRLGDGAGARGSGDLCRIRFRVLASGDAGLAFTRASVKDPGNKILVSAFQPVRIRAR